MKPICFAFALFATCLAAGGAQARSYDCANPEHAPGGNWDLNRDLVKDLSSAADAKFAGGFMYRMCGVVENGAQAILIDAIRQHGNTRDCADSGNFAVFYDPKTQAFGDVIPNQAFFCPEAAR